MELKARKALKEQMALRVPLVHKALKARKALTELKELKE